MQSKAVRIGMFVTFVAVMVGINFIIRRIEIPDPVFWALAAFVFPVAAVNYYREFKLWRLRARWRKSAGRGSR